MFFYVNLFFSVFNVLKFILCFKHKQMNSNDAGYVLKQIKYLLSMSIIVCMLYLCISIIVDLSKLLYVYPHIFVAIVYYF